MRVLVLSLFVLLVTFSQVNAQIFSRTHKPATFSAELYAYQDTLAALRQKVLNEREDLLRERYNARFHAVLASALEQKDAFFFPFDSIASIADLVSEDQVVRLLNWNLPFNNQTHQYFGFVLIHDQKSNETRVHVLNDVSAELTRVENKQLDNNNWYGCLYFEIITTKVGKKKKLYTLLGWDGNDALTTKKVIDALYIASNGVPKFGAPVFKMEKHTQRRVFIEYASGVLTSLKYHPKEKQIVYDHLSPSNPELEGSFQFYGPDFTYDALRWSGKHWEYVSNVEVKGDTSVEWNDPQE